jgi:hypothetical protein
MVTFGICKLQARCLWNCLLCNSRRLAEHRLRGRGGQREQGWPCRGVVEMDVRGRWWLAVAHGV